MEQADLILTSLHEYIEKVTNLPETLYYIRRIYLTSHEGQPAKIFPMLVEEKIKQSDAISNCVVVARLKENSANYEAVAFVIRKEQKHDDIEQELRDICANAVPSYMQPVEYRFVTEFPHTPVGKVDFRALEQEAQKNKV